RPTGRVPPRYRRETLRWPARRQPAMYLFWPCGKSILCRCLSMYRTIAMPADTAPSMSPAERYAADLQRPGIVRDPAQAAAVIELQRIYTQLQDTPPRFFRRHRKPVKGLYLWGGVGRGKTWIMDCFYETLPMTQKRRVHFHRFMQSVHE